MTRPIKILIADDDVSTRELLRTLLEEEYSLNFAETGAECIKKIKQFIPDLILLDIVLPDISGIDLCQQITADDQFSDIPIILVTVKTKDIYVQKGLEAGAIDYIKKPIRHLELTARVRSALKMTSLVKQLRRSGEEKQKLIEELGLALSQVKELSGLLPICAQCKNVRDDNGYWQQIEDFIHDHADVSFSHSLCPHCAENIYGRESWFKSKKK